MNRLLVCLCLSIAFFAAGVMLPRAASPGAPAQSVPAGSPLDELGWFVGGTWTAEEEGSDGSALLVKMNCHWAENKNAILFNVRFVSGGKEIPQYEGMFVWHPGKRKLVLWQVNRKGEVAEGELTVEGKEMRQTVRVSHPDGKEHFLKANYERLGNDAFRFKAYFRLSESAEWQDALDLVYKRQPLDAPSK